MASRTIQFSTDKVLSFFNADDSANESDSNVGDSFSEPFQPINPSNVLKSMTNEDKIVSSVSELDNEHVQGTNSVEIQTGGTRSVDKDLWPWGELGI